MDPAFDPYREWLEIPDGERPPNHYVLLGLKRFEGNAEKIEAAAHHRMGLLRKFQSGPRGRFVQQVISEVTRAKLCLLHPERKRHYDEELQLIEENQSMSQLLGPPQTPISEDSLSHPPESSATPTNRVSSIRPTRSISIPPPLPPIPPPGTAQSLQADSGGQGARKSASEPSQLTAARPASPAAQPQQLPIRIRPTRVRRRSYKLLFGVLGAIFFVSTIALLFVLIRLLAQ